MTRVLPRSWLPPFAMAPLSEKTCVSPSLSRFPFWRVPLPCGFKGEPNGKPSSSSSSSSSPFWGGPPNKGHTPMAPNQMNPEGFDSECQAPRSTARIPSSMAESATVRYLGAAAKLRLKGRTTKPYGSGSKMGQPQNGLPWHMETWPKTCGPLLA